MPKLKKLTLIGIKSESTQGSVASLAATDYFFAEAPEIKINAEKLPRDYSRATLGPLTHQIGKQTVDVTFKMEMKGSGDASIAYNPLTAALAACGLTASRGTGSASGVLVFTPAITSESSSFYGPGRSATIVLNHDGIKHTVPGSLGSVKITAEAGKIPMLEYTFKGLWNEPVDAAFDSTIASVNTLLPPIVQNATLSVQGLSPIATKFDFDLGSSVQQRDDVSSSAGVLGFLITGFESKASYDPEVPTLASHNVFNRLMTGTTGALTLTIGTVAGNRFDISLPQVQYDDVSYADRNGLLIYNIPLVVGSDNYPTNFISISAY